MYGYMNRLLAVDLTTGQWDVAPLNPDYVRDYIGGRGLGARYLYDLLPPESDPLGPDNVAILMTGPFTGTEAYSCHKYEWVTKSPLTGTYLCSNCGGMLGVSLRKAGYDGLILKGASDRPLYLFIDETGLELRDATAVWGQTVSQTRAQLGAEIGSTAAIGCIGPAGEPPRSVRFASFFDGQRSAGRGGLGSVLGSKRLKAIAVMPGHQEVPVYDPEGLGKLLPELARTLKQDRISGDAIPQVGSMIWLDALALDGLLPVRNYQASATYDQIRGRVDSDTYRTQFTHPPKGGNGSHAVSCYRCPIQSAKFCTPDQGAFKGKRVRGPEFQSAWALGVNCGVFDYRPIVAAYASCNDYGVDTLSFGGTVGFAMECWQRGLLDRARIERDYDGLQLEWGNCEAVLELVAIVGTRRGWLGELLADGVRAASGRIPGSEEFALHVKGMEFPGYDPRGYWSMALAYATSCRGACHLKSWTAGADYEADPGLRTARAGKAEGVMRAENLRALIDSALICTFASGSITEDWIVRLVRAVIGVDLAGQIDTCGARICDLERRLALREGLTREDDRLPDRVLEGPIRGGDWDGTRIGQENFDWMLEEYYALRGWTPEGVPATMAAEV